MRFILAFLFSFLFTLCGMNQSIPNERLVDWSHAGLTQELIVDGDPMNVLELGFLGDSLTDNALAFQNTILGLGGEPGILYFPPGNYIFKSSLLLPSNLVLRGAGSDSTKFYFDLNGSNAHCMIISNTQTREFVKVISGFEKESAYIIVAEPSNFLPGDYIELRQRNGDWDTKPAEWAQNVAGQILSVMDYVGDTIYLNNQLRLNYDSSLNLGVRKINPVQNCGLECFYIQRLDEPALAGGSNIYLNYVVNCLISGIESNVSSGSHILIQSSSNIQIEGCYIHHAFKYDGSNTNGYGITLNKHSGECLIQDNVFKHLRHAMMVKEGANGNVFAYNYSIEPNRSESISDLSADISLHGHYPYANLFEGNVVQNIFTDHYWGPAGPYNTFFRNRVELYGITITTDNLLITSSQNYIGNEITKSGLFLGKYELNGEDHYEYGNNKFNETIPPSTNNLNIHSLFLDSMPQFWPDYLTWPPIGYPNTLDENKIPAQLRFESDTSLTYCSSERNNDFTDPDPDTDTDTNLSTNQNYLIITPNPFNSELNIHLAIEQEQEINIDIFKMNGVKIFSKSVQTADGIINLVLHENIPSGNYIIHIETKEYNFRRIIIKY